MGVGAGQGPGAAFPGGDFADAALAVGALGDHDGEALLEVGRGNGRAAEVARRGIRRPPEGAKKTPDPECDAHLRPYFPYFAEVG